MFNFIKRIFSNEPYKIQINHEDWIVDRSNPRAQPYFLIPKKQHRKGSRPKVKVFDEYATYEDFKNNGEITVYRGLFIWQGTPRTITVEIY